MEIDYATLDSWNTLQDLSKEEKEYFNENVNGLCLELLSNLANKEQKCIINSGFRIPFSNKHFKLDLEFTKAEGYVLITSFGIVSIDEYLDLMNYNPPGFKTLSGKKLDKLNKKLNYGNN